MAREVSPLLTADLMRMLSAQEVAGILGISRGTWTTYVSRGQAPAPDVPGSQPMWRAFTVAQWQASRRAPNRSREK